jgi:hypothetical protein
MPTFYTIKHKATGLYFKPANDTRGINVSKKGKVYNRKPSIHTYDGMRLRMGFGEIGRTWHFNDIEILVDWNRDDWDLIEHVSTSTAVPW